MKEVYDFLKDAEVYYLATIDGDYPRVRPFGTINLFEDKLYIQTGKSKNVSKQISVNSNVEICAFKEGKWIRISTKLINDDRKEAKEAMLNVYPHLKDMYSSDDDNTQVLYMSSSTATIYSFTSEPVVIEF